MKIWYQSLTVWVNIFAILVFLLAITGVLDLNSDETILFGSFIGVLNLILRIYYTRKPIGTPAPEVEQYLKS